MKTRVRKTEGIQLFCFFTIQVAFLNWLWSVVVQESLLNGLVSFCFFFYNWYKLLECVILWYILWGQIISFIYYILWLVLYFIFLFHWQETRVLLIVVEVNWVQKPALCLLRKTPSFCRKSSYKLYYYKWCVSPQASSVSLYKVTARSFSIQWRAPMGEQVVRSCF